MFTRLFAIVGLIVASACCTQLPKVGRKRIAVLPSTAADHWRR